MYILSAEGFFEIELCQKTRISLIKLYDKYLPFCNFYALVSHAIFFFLKDLCTKNRRMSEIWKLANTLRYNFERLGRF